MNTQKEYIDKKTLVVGASTNPDRYSYQAVYKLRQHHHSVVAFGLKSGQVDDVLITTDWPSADENFDTVTMYIGPANQDDYIDKVIALHPLRVIFNPGTENPEFYKKLDAANIAHEEACTLVKLSIGSY